MITNMLPPAFVFVLGAVLIPFLRGKAKAVYMLALPVVVFITLLNLSLGNTWIVEFWGYELIMGRVDKLSLIFAYVFTIMAFLGILFALQVKDNLQHVSGLVYAGSTLGVVLAGDF
ncbi:MAG: Na(+)/H(+) antiporter subunit D, partial [Proteobacteria bacterium]|nr:Na(+)/H(+) antiporter subunit D [Pseudomonadota bacterium]